MKTFQDLSFFSLGGVGAARQALLQFDNMLGVSVIEERNALDNCQKYELAVVHFEKDGHYKIIYPGFVKGDTVEHIDENEVTRLMKLVQEWYSSKN